MILVTGGTGFVGRHVASRLVEGGQRVRVLSRRIGPEPQTEALMWAQGDLTDPASLRAALRDVQTVVHAAARVPRDVRDDTAYQHVNVAGTESLARIVREFDVRQFVHISSAGVYGDGNTESPHREDDAPTPGTPYERSKLEAERALAGALTGSPVHWTILRPQGVFGPDRPATARFFRDVMQRTAWLHGPTRVLVHPTHISDLATVVERVVGRDDLHGEVVNVGGERALDFRDLITMIGTVVGHVPYQLTAPAWTGRLARVAARLWSAVAEPPAVMLRIAHRLINRAVNTEKARRLFRFEPVTLAWALDQTASEMRREGLL